MFGSIGGRSRWAAVGAVVAVSVGAGGVLTSSAAGSAGASSFVPITPCRLVDTRPAPETVGSRAVPVGVNDTFVVQVTGSNGNCVIPATATGVSLNVTVIVPSSSSFLTVFPSDKPRPLTANLNWVANQAPTPNAVTAALSADGKVSVYNLSGTVNLTVDVVGFYEPSTSGPAGPAGPAGVAGAGGAVGPAGPVNRISDAQIAVLAWYQDPGRAMTVALPAGATTPFGVAFDGTNIWTTNYSTANVTRINPATGAGTNIPLPASSVPIGVVFDGTNIWTANSGTANVSKLLP